MASTQRTTAVAVFDDTNKANCAIQELRKAGFKDDHIGVLGRDADKTKGGTHEKGSKWEQGAVAGALTGAGTGTLIGLGVLSGIIPAIGPVIAAGALGFILLNAAGGTAIGGLIGALIGLGIPEEEAHYYEGELKAGRTLLTVKAEGRYEEALAILRRCGGWGRSTARPAAAATAVCATTSTAAATGGKTMQLREEELRVTKQPVEKGEVRVRKEVVTEHRTVDVPVQREEVVIERRPVTGQSAGGEIKAGQEIRVPIREEEVHIDKVAVVKEEIAVGKRKIQETEHVQGTVRKEKAHVEREGKVDVTGHVSGKEECRTDDRK